VFHHRRIRWRIFNLFCSIAFFTKSMPSFRLSARLNISLTNNFFRAMELISRISKSPSLTARSVSHLPYTLPTHACNHGLSFSYPSIRISRQISTSFFDFFEIERFNFSLQPMTELRVHLPLKCQKNRCPKVSTFVKGKSRNMTGRMSRHFVPFAELGKNSLHMLFNSSRHHMPAIRAIENTRYGLISSASFAVFVFIVHSTCAPSKKDSSQAAHSAPSASSL